MATAPPHVVRVKRELLTACMTCPLCHKLLRDATTISECLHTFCRKCIFEKLTDEEVDCCPICDTDLGCVPVEKLIRSDHNLQDLRAKIFPFKRRKVDAPESPTISLPFRRKEKSLSSLVVNTPRVANQSGLTGRRTKAVSRRSAAIRGFSASIEESNKEEKNDVEDPHGIEMLSKISPNRSLLNSSDAKLRHQSPNKHTENGESYQDKAELWKPLNCLVEAANKTKALKFSPQSSVMKEQIRGPDRKIHIPRSKFREHLNNSNAQDKIGNITTSRTLPKTRKSSIFRRRKEIGASAQALVDAAASSKNERTSPIWFSLVASADKDRDALLQLSANYLRIKDGTIPASFIQKYLVKKLDLSSEAEVDIACGGELVEPAMTLHDVVDKWLRVRPSRMSPTSVGSTARDFVIVLVYRRHRAPPP